MAWIDWNYRTFADREHRLLIGRSMGGHAAIRLALRHPDVFGGASIDAGFMAVAEGFFPTKYQSIRLVTPGPPFEFAPTYSFYSAGVFSFCAAFTPNMNNPPWYVDFILDANGEIDSSVEQRLLAHSPPALVDQYAGSEYPLDLFLRIGDRDEYSDTFWPVVDALEANDLPHLVRVFQGGHYTYSVADKLGVHLTYFMPIKATAEISPRVADPRLYPKRLRVALELPGDLDVEDIDCATLALIDIDGNRLDCPIGCAAACEISDVNGNGRDDLSVWLPCDAMTRAAVAGGAVPGDQVDVRCAASSMMAASSPPPTPSPSPTADRYRVPSSEPPTRLTRAPRRRRGVFLLEGAIVAASFPASPDGLRRGKPACDRRWQGLSSAIGFIEVTEGQAGMGLSR